VPAWTISVLGEKSCLLPYVTVIADRLDLIAGSQKSCASAPSG
ncbi:unnamed protein product, partial [Musa hybrid cultivar]